MSYTPEMITVPTTKGDRTIEVMRKVGTGLAYHKTVSGDQWTITHVPTTYAVCALTMGTEAEVQAWLEAILARNLVPDMWNVPRSVIQKHILGLIVQIELAHHETKSPYSIFMYGGLRDGDVMLDSTDAVADPQSEMNIHNAREIFRHYPSVVCVHLVRMDERTGIHDPLHTYTREQLMDRVTQ